MLSALYHEQKKAKEIKERKDVLDQDESKLFGVKFREFVTEHVKSKKKAQKIVSAFKVTSSPGKGRTNRLFRKGPLPSSSRTGRGQSYQGYVFGGNRGGHYRGQSNNYREQSSNRGQNYRGKNFSVFTRLLSCRPIINCSVSSSSPPGEDSLQKPDSRYTSSRKAVTFSGQLEKVDFRFLNSRNSQGLSNSIFKQPNSSATQNPIGRENEPVTRNNCGLGNFGNVEDRSYCESQPSGGSVSEYNFSCRQKGWGSSSGSELEKLEQFHPTHPFQNGGTTSSKRTSATKRLLSEARSEGRYYSVPLSHHSRKFFRFQ